RVEAHRLATRGDRGQHVLAAVGQQQQVHELGRFLERLQHAVGRLVVHRLDRLDHEDAPSRLERRARRRRDDRLLDVGDEHLGRARAAHPRQVGVRVALDPLPHAAGIVLLVRQQRRREGARDRALARARGAVEEVCVRRSRPLAQRRAEHGTRVRVGVDARQCLGQLGRLHGDHRRGAARRHTPRVVTVPRVARGRLITIEGLDGAGKSTLAGALAEAIASSGHDVELLREPGGVELSERIRALVKDPGLEVSARAEALLYAAARAELVHERMLPLLDDGRFVLLDRYVDSSLAYQGAARGLGVEQVRAINRFATGGVEPDRTLLLRIDPALGRARLGDRGEQPDRLELEDAAFFVRIAAAYDELAAAEPQRIRVLDASFTPATVLSDALEALADLLAPGPPARG